MAQKPAQANDPDIPLLHPDELALLRHVVSIAHQLPGDWSHMGALEPGQEGDDSYRYQLSAMTSMLATVQFHRTPAYRELCKDAIGKMIDKMLRFDVWGYWELTSKGGVIDDPDLKELGEGWINPVERKNVMYSGHLLNMVNLHDMLYRDGKFSKTNALKFEYKTLFRGMGPETFQYNEEQILQFVLHEFETNNYLGCECEPNLIFPYCNQYPILACMLHDHIHGTDIAPGVMKKHTKAWLKEEGGLFSDKDTKVENLPLMHLVKQKFSVPNGALAAGLSVVLHPWKRDYAQRLYEKVKQHLVTEDADGNMSVDQIVDVAPFLQEGPDPTTMGVSTFGFVLLAAKEMGDEKTERGLLDFIDKNLTAVRENGRLYYERYDDLSSPHYATRLTTNGMIPWARMNPKDGLWKLYNQPWAEEEVNAPQLVDIDYPNVLVNRAYYDQKAKTMYLGLVRGDSPPKDVTFRVANLKKTSEGPAIKVNRQLLQSDRGTARWSDDGLRLTVPFDDELDITIAA